MQPTTPPQAFDLHADDYDRELQQGLALAGENKVYFAQGRVRRLCHLLGERRFAPGSILDFGCGTGDTTAKLKEAFPHATVHGADPSPRSVGLAKARYPTLTFLPIEGFATSGPYNLCYCNGVFHHIPPAKRDRYLQAIHDSLYIGGWLALFENNPLNPGARLVMRRIPFDRDAIPLPPWETVRRVRNAGFTIERIDYLFYFPRALRFLRTLEAFLHRVPLGAQYLVLARRAE